jgi:hypothetical protein
MVTGRERVRLVEHERLRQRVEEHTEEREKEGKRET